MHRSLRQTGLVLVAVAATAAATFLPVDAAPPGRGQAADPRAVAAPRPLVYDRDFADPSVVTDGTRWLGAATGWRGRGSVSPSEYGPWQRAGALLDSKPAWARYGGVWAPDLERAPDGTWLAYFTMPALGMRHHQDRCIGVARAPHLGAQFTPVGDAPLVCPAHAPVAPASDRLVDHPRWLPQRGVIDPASYVRGDGRRYLLYRTQGKPSTIRMVRLTPDGTRAARRSVQLMTDADVLENPLMVQDRGWNYLITSRGDYGSCRYRTVWRRSKFLHKGWQGTRDRVLLNRQRTGVCGPGGADYVPDSATQANRMFFHGWVCKGTNLPCYMSYSGHRDYEDVGKRALYAVRVQWTRDGPRIASFAQGPEWTPPPSPSEPVPTESTPTPPSPTATTTTPTPTGSPTEPTPTEPTPTEPTPTAPPAA